MVENNEKCIVTLNNTKEIKKNIYHMVDMFKENKLECAPDMNYEWNSIVEKLNNILLNKE